MDFQAIRKEYENAGIDETKLPTDPMELFKAWYETAVETCPGKWIEPNAMAIATSDGAGLVTNRWVLLKKIESDRVGFFTNYDSCKGKQLALNPRCAVALHWPYLGRQVRILGVTQKMAREISEEYFHSRPRGSQLGAAASAQSQPVESREVLDTQRTKLDQQHAGQEVPLPETWGGYWIQPDQFEFWQGRSDRLHDRVVFELEGTDWVRNRLSP